MSIARVLLVCSLAALLMWSAAGVPPVTAAGAPRLSQVVLTDVEDGTQNKTAFGTTTAYIYAYFWLVDVPRDTTLTCVWVAENTAVAPANYQIDKVDLKVGGLINRGRCSLSKPTNNWPVGDYRLDISLQSKIVYTARFKIR